MFSLERGCCGRFQCICHTHHRFSILFLYEKKIPNNLDINYISNLLFTDKTILCIMKFYKYIYCLKSLNANTISCMLFLDTYTVPNNCFQDV